MDAVWLKTYTNPGPSRSSEYECQYTVEYLREFFFKLPLEEKIVVKYIGRPKPAINLTQITKGTKRDFKRLFKMELYEKYDWLCGCETTNRLFCFPCLLFIVGNAESAWVRTGMADLSHLAQKARNHERSQIHINSELELRLLGKTDLKRQLDSAYRREIEQHNDSVLKNRYVLSKIINCIKFCGIFELALRGHDEQLNSENPGIFKGLINFSSELDVALKEHFETASVFKCNSKIIQNELLDCMLLVCQEHIKKEIAEAQFLSVIVDETADVSLTFQITLVFRYILKDGSPVERFWAFLIPEDHDAASLANSIKEALEGVIKTPEKLISQSYDGANVISGRHGVNKIIQNEYKKAFYVHCYAHDLNSILSHATSQNPEVRIFFSNLTDITNFFSNSPHRLAILDEIQGRNIPKTPTTRWLLESRAVNIIYENREVLIECMENIQNNSRQSAAVSQASAIQRMLYDSKFVFWLTFYAKIMPHSGILYDQLQKSTIDPTQVAIATKKFEECIQRERGNIEDIPELIEDVTHIRSKRRKEDPYYARVLAAKEVCDCILVQIKDRFSFSNHLSGSLLFLPDNFPSYERNFPKIYLNDIVQSYPVLDQQRLQSELEIIYQRPDFRNLSGAVHCLKFFIENKLQKVFSATYDLLQIIVTIPMCTAETERNFSTLKRIKTFSRSTINEDRLSAIAMLSIEKKLVQDIPDFNNLVISKFAENEERRTDFVFKHCV